MTLKIKDRLMGLMLLLAMAGGPTLPAAAGGPYQARSEGSYRDEEAQLRALIQQDPKNPSAYLRLGVLFEGEAAESYAYTPDYSSYDYTKAIRVYRAAIAVADPSAEIYFRLGSNLYDSQTDENVSKIKARQDEGLLKIRQAIGIDPDNDEYYVKLGNILKNRGESAAAIEAYKTAINLKLKPNHRSSLNQAMGYELISDYLRAKGALNAAAAARDKSAAILCKIERSCPGLMTGKAVEAVPQPRVRSTYPSVPFRGRDILRDRLRGSPSVKIKHIYNF
jgi:tetratricopeptide (TPR) repeat protein